MSARRRLYANTSELRSAVRRLMEEQHMRTARDVTTKSGGAINYQTVDTILSFRVETVRLSTLEKLARALKANVDDLVKLTATAEPWLLPTLFDEVPMKLRKNIEHALAEMLRTTGIIK